MQRHTVMSLRHKDSPLQRPFFQRSGEIVIKCRTFYLFFFVIRDHLQSRVTNIYILLLVFHERYFQLGNALLHRTPGMRFLSLALQGFDLPVTGNVVRSI